MKRIKDILIGVIIGSMLFAVPIFAQAINSINVKLNAINVQLEGEPVEVNSILYEGNTYLPMRKIAELVGKDVEWRAETMTANITDINKENVITKSPKVQIINGEKYYSASDITDLININKINEYEYIQYSIYPSRKAKQGNYILTLSRFEGELGRSEMKLIDNIPYVVNKHTSYIKKDYYEQTILPLIK